MRHLKRLLPLLWVMLAQRWLREVRLVQNKFHNAKAGIDYRNLCLLCGVLLSLDEIAVMDTTWIALYITG